MSDVVIRDLRAATILGGTSVLRAVPQPRTRAVGPWCAIDVLEPGATGLPAHGLAGHQALTWLYSGHLRHTDGLGTDEVVGPGEVLMVTAGRGVVHAEEAVGGDPVHGVALRLVLPAASRDSAPEVESFWPEPVRMGDHEVAIFVGELGWEDSPVTTHTPAVGAEVRFASDEPLVIDAREGWEYAVLPDAEAVTVGGAVVEPGQVAIVTPGSSTLSIGAHASAGRVARALVLGGAVIEEPLLHWWDFVGGDHDEIAALRRDYQAALGLGEGDASRFAVPPGTDASALTPAPELPPGRLVARRPPR
ncbi:MAG: pirin family protein [Actinomycetes bacterium]